MSKQFLQLKLRRVSAVCGFLLIGWSISASTARCEDAAYVDERQNAKLNISVIQLKNAREKDIELEQQGIKNISISTQVDEMSGDEEGNDAAKYNLKQTGNTNVNAAYQDASLNESVVSQDASNKASPTERSKNSLTVTDVGDGDLLVRFKSGEVDIMTLTSSGYAATSRFGRGH